MSPWKLPSASLSLADKAIREPSRDQFRVSTFSVSPVKGFAFLVAISSSHNLLAGGGVRLVQFTPQNTSATFPRSSSPASLTGGLSDIAVKAIDFPSGDHLNESGIRVVGSVPIHPSNAVSCSSTGVPIVTRQIWLPPLRSKRLIGTGCRKALGKLKRLTVAS